MALYESAEEVQESVIEAFDRQTGRGDFLRRMLLVGAGVAAGGAAVASGAVPALAAELPTGHTRAGVPMGDIDILNYALTLEHLEATFYRKHESSMKMSGMAAQIDRYVRIFAREEAAHVAALTSAIQQFGGMPVKEGMYKFPPLTLTFGSTVENLGVHAYLGAAKLIKTPAILLTAASIVTVEARHAAAWMTLNKQNPTLGAFDTGESKADVVATVKPFIVG